MITIINIPKGILQQVVEVEREFQTVVRSDEEARVLLLLRHRVLVLRVL